MLLAATFGGCASAPVQKEAPWQPSAVPTVSQAPATPGSLFIAGRRGLFEDARARAVGDILTLRIQERADASKGASQSLSKKSDTSSKLSALLGLPLSTPKLPIIGEGLNGDIGATSNSQFDGKGAQSQNQSFTTSMSVTVKQVMPNGNLVIAGEKRVALGQGEEVIKIQGVVRPEDVRPDNSVTSSQVADARISYRGAGDMDRATRMGFLQRFFMSAWPF